ncbi:hypothetical protein BOX15_Mlig027867g3 [Macrostomum lignano]|uniref:Uncharacterized protein n=1 Tax=Macrostomum lignano TaxID=282301 RepID=A0A267E470_9PLAT|nr:hypothetical protein BOX15_Mlig027867g3 [Macrostomum lignano]
MVERTSDTGTFRSAVAADRTKTAVRVSSLTKKGYGSGVGASRHRGYLLKRRAAVAKFAGSAGLRESSVQQQQQQSQREQQCLLDMENPKLDFQLRQMADEDLFCAEEPQHQQLQNSLSCGGTAFTSTSGPGLQLFGGGGGSHLQSAGCSAALQDVSASAILQQHQKQQQQQQQRAEQLDVSMLMHSGFYGTREEVEQLLAQAIQLHCRPNSKLGDSNSKAADCWSSLPQQHQPRPGPKTSVASTAGLAEDLLQAWSGGGGSGGKSVHFSLDSPSNTASCQQKLPPPATAATPRPTMRNQLLLTDFSEEETAAEPEAETAVFLTAKPPVPKPRTDRRSASLNRQRAQPAPSGSQQMKLRNCNAAVGQPPGSASRPPQPPLTQPRSPVPTPTPRQRRMGGPAPAAASTLRCLPPPQSPPVPRQRRRLSVSSLQGHRQPLDEPCRGLSAYSTPLTQAAESDEVGQHRIDEDNATVKPEFVGTALGQLLQTRLRHSQSFSGGSAGADDEVLRFDLENALTTARRPQGPKRTASRAEQRRFGQFKRGQQLDNVPGL